MNSKIDKPEIEKAHERIKPFVLNTKLIHSEGFDEIAGCEVWLKCENEQKVKAFKARGATNAVLQLSENERAKGITTHSSGNHAQAIAYAASLVNSKAYVVMPENAPKVKIAGVESWNAEIIFCEATLEARESTVNQVIQKTGATFIHPFDNDAVIAGQATVSKEILEEKPDLYAILAPVGGGGLLSGTGLGCKYFSKNTKVYGTEPEGAADAIFSFRSGKVEKAKFIKTLADGLQTNLSERTLSIIKDSVDEILLVNEENIVKSMKLVKEHFGMWIEPSSAVAIAALLQNTEKFRGQKVAIIITGGNLDLEKFGLKD